MPTEKLDYQIEGITPIMTHSPQGMLVASSSSRGAKKIASPQEEAEMGCYRTPEGYCGIPAVGVRNAILTASKMHKVKRNSLKTFVSHIQIEPSDLLILHDSNNNPIKEYEINTSRVVIKMAGAVMRSRPIFKDWRVSFSLFADTELLPSDPYDLFKMLLDDAGSRIGLCEYRPEKSGWYGRFKVIE